MRLIPILNVISAAVCGESHATTPPHMVYVLADDLGYGDNIRNIRAMPKCPSQEQ